MNNETFLWLVLGICAGLSLLPWYQGAYKRLLVGKTLDGTAEYIDGVPYYILSNEDWTLLRAWRLPMLHRHTEAHPDVFTDDEVLELMKSPVALELAAHYNMTLAEDAHCRGLTDATQHHIDRRRRLLSMKSEIAGPPMRRIAQESAGACCVGELSRG